MRCLSLLAAIVTVAVALGGCSDAGDPDPSSSTSSDTTSMGGELSTLGTLYLHASGSRTWMDAQAGGSTQDVPLAALGNLGPSTARFTLEPPLASPAMTSGFARVVLRPAADVAEATIRASLEVEGAEFSNVTLRGRTLDFFLPVPRSLGAGQDIVLVVCACGTNSTDAQSYVLDTRGGSTMHFPTPGADGTLPRGTVTVRREGTRFLAERVDASPIEVPAGSAQTDLRTVNGDVTQSAAAYPSLEVRLWGRGDTDSEARARIETMYVESSADTADGLRLFAEVKTTETGSEAWQDRGGDVRARLPEGTMLSMATLATTNGDVTAHDFTVASMHTRTTNGDIDATGALSSWTASTTNGGVGARLSLPPVSGRYALSTTNGNVDLAVAQDASHGVDASAETTNGQATLAFAGAEPVGEQSPTSAHVRTQGYSSRTVRTEIVLGSTNGDVAASDR